MKRNPLLHRLMRRLAGDTGGVAMTEFAMAAPIFLLASLWGLETANYAITIMRVNQTAAHVSDNIARIGDTATLQNRKIFEEEIADIMIGAHLQAGQSIDLFEHGRMAVSSLEYFDNNVHCIKKGCPNTTAENGTAFIWWQRCTGKMEYEQFYGKQNSVMKDGMGPADAKVYPELDGSTIFVELNYEYQPLFSDRFISNAKISAIASNVVRAHRDRTEIYKRNSLGTPAETECKNFLKPPGT